jgi:N-acyl-D-amino-acid deacylase
MKKLPLLFLFVYVLISCSTPDAYDVIIRDGKIMDGSGNASFIGDVGLNADTIAAIGDLGNAKGIKEIDAKGLVVAPGFINMLSWSVASLIEDGKSQSDIRQGVTLEVFGEGWSMGPLTEKMKREEEAEQGDIKYKVEWTTLNEYLEYLTQKGISPNVASFVGATTLRINTIGYEDR